jgi:endogenous inhibitor of DNA gyrase (YacG/DUF329 family)
MIDREGQGPKHRCSWCERVYRRAESLDFPFCSSRCRLLDLGQWLDGAYAIHRPASEEDEALLASRADLARPEEMT